MRRKLLGLIVALALAVGCDGQGTGGPGSPSGVTPSTTTSTNNAATTTTSATTQSTNGGSGQTTNGGAGQTTNGGAGQTTNGGAGQSVNGGAGQPANGGAGQTTNDGAGQTTNGGTVQPQPTYELNPRICRNYQCQHFTENYDPVSKSFIKSYDGAKWLKIRKKPFNTTDGFYFKEINNYMMTNGIVGAMPVVVRVDCPPDHKFRYFEYSSKEPLYLQKIEVASLNQYNAQTKILYGELTSLYNAYLTGFNMTVLDYLPPQYQSATPEKQLPPFNDPKLSVVHQPAFTVMTRNFSSYYGTDFSHRTALGLAQELNIEFTTYYTVNYFTGFYEVWLTADPANKLFA